MTWSDLRAFVNHLPMTSHFWRKEEPEAAARLAWMEGLASPQMVLLGELYDLFERNMFGQSSTPVLRRMQQPALEAMQQQEEREVPEMAPEQAPPRRRKTAAEIRAQLARAQQQ